MRLSRDRRGLGVKLKSALLVLLFLIAQGSSAEDDPKSFDEPKTEPMDYNLIRGELVMGIDSVLESQDQKLAPGINGNLSYTGISPQFSWGGVIDISMPVDSLQDIDWATVDVIAGGRWNFLNNKDAKSQLGIGIDVLSFEHASKEVDFSSQHTTPGLDPSDIVRSSIRGMIASLSGTLLNLFTPHGEQFTDTWEIGVGWGKGEYGVNAPGRGSLFVSGGIFHARLHVRAFDDAGSFRCVFTNSTGNDQWHVSQLVVTASYEFKENWELSGGIKHTQLHTPGIDGNFQVEDPLQFDDGRTRVFIGIGYGF